MSYRVICECGYHVGGLSKATAIRWAEMHTDDGGYCDPLVENEDETC